MRVGVSDAPPWSWLTENGEVLGLEVQLVQHFANQIGAQQIDWESGSQHELLERLHKKEVHLVIGGITATSPWKTRVAFTQPYLVLKDSTGAKHRHVMAAPRGENRFLLTLEKYLQSRRQELRETFKEAGYETDQ